MMIEPGDRITEYKNCIINYIYYLERSVKNVQIYSSYSSSDKILTHE